MARLRTHVIADRGVAGAPPPRGLLLLLHGHDATEHDLTPIGPLLDPDARFLVAGARGPIEVPRDAAAAGAAWFTSGPRGVEGLAEAVDALHATIDDLRAEHGLGAGDPVIIGGFSQGAAMALAAGLVQGDRPHPAGILSLSGFLVDADELTYDWEGARATSVLVQHGTRDEVVPIELGRDTADVLAMHGVAVRFESYDMSHQTTLESLTAARGWLVDLVP